jgi:hypothetical protein
MPPKSSEAPAKEAQSNGPVKSSQADDALEKAEAAKEKKTRSTVEGMKGEDELDAAIAEAEKS